MKRELQLSVDNLSSTLWFITGATDVQPIVRLSPSPYGERVQWRLAAEKVLSSVVRRLLESDIWPFGTRRLAGTLGQSREEQVQALKERLKEMFEGSSLVPEEDALQRMAESVLRVFASDEEGLEELGPEPQ